MAKHDRPTFFNKTGKAALRNNIPSLRKSKDSPPTSADNMPLTNSRCYQFYMYHQHHQLRAVMSNEFHVLHCLFPRVAKRLL